MPGADEVGQPEQERAGPQEPVAPDEAGALGEPRAQRRAVGLALLLERRPHGQQGQAREGVGDDVDQERQRPGEPEQRPPERRAGQPDHRQPARTGTGGARQLPHRHDGPQGAGLRGQEHRRAAALDKGDQRDHPEGEPVRHDRHDQDPDREHADGVGPDHQPPAVPAVGDHTGRQRQHRRGQRAGERHNPRLGRRPRQGQHEQRVGDQPRLGPDARQQLPGLQQQEVPVAPQRSRAHTREQGSGSMLRRRSARR